MMLRRRRKRDSFLPWIQLFVDCAAIYGVLFLVFWVRFMSGRFERLLDTDDYWVYYNAFHLTALTTVFFMRSNGLYRTGLFFTFGQETAKVFKSVISSVLVLTAASFFIRDFSFSRTFLIIAGVFLAVGVAAARYIVGVIVMKIDIRRGSLRNILIAGCEENAAKLARYYKKNPRSGRSVIAFLNDGAKKDAVYEGLPVLGGIDDLPRILKENRQIHEVVLALQNVPVETVLKMICDCEKEMVSFRRVADMFGLITARMSVSYAGGVSVLSFTDSPLGDWENRFIKRTADILLSAVALLCLSPVFFVLALIVKTSSRGPVFYRQERIGQDGRHFMLLKFRTMVVDAEKDSGPVWARENDPRRTKIGTFLRENNLDELPQLWNVFRGHMSLVGPRPERPHFVSQFKEDIPRYMARHSIRSGITGWAQVNGLRGNTSIEERTKYDLYYIENWSFVLDMKIIFMTFFARQNAY